MCEKDLIRKAIRPIFAIAMALALVLSTFMPRAFAADAKAEVSGRMYIFDKASHYEFSDTKKYSTTDKNNTYGNFFIGGNVENVTTKDEIPAYEVGDGSLKLFYNYGDTLLKAKEDSWHIVEDKDKKINDIKLGDKILTGAIILQTSKDRMNWVNVAKITDAFNKTPIRTRPIYETKDVELINGCYYRLIVAYEMGVKTEDKKILFINRDKHDYKKCAEIYEFYAYSDTGSENTEESRENYKLGSKVRVADFDTYAGEKSIGKADPHYGWDLGDFFVSGYTDKIENANGNTVFLKNVGDKVTLWFRLNQDINKLNGNDKLSITADREGSDQYFETPTMDFGRGVLIFRYTDYKNEKAEPTIYTNYLESNTSLGSDTKVSIFEEGDYEVALDYEITDNRLIDKKGHYRIFFNFSVRNGNCMVYPFDLETGSELTNKAVTENGFYLDLAKSRYLKVHLKRETLKEGADGLVEDTRFNGPARDGAKYTDEGIYTITVSNQYTGQSTAKKIYVGSNKVLKSHMTTGLDISEINKLVDEGAEISDDGNIKLNSSQESVEETINENDEKDFNTLAENPSEDIAVSPNKKQERDFAPLIIIGTGACILGGFFWYLFKKKDKKKKAGDKKKDQGDEK